MPDKVPRPSRRRPKCIAQHRTSIRNRISPVLERLSARWLRFCAKRLSVRVKGVTERDPATLSKHEFYGTLNGVKYYDVQSAFNEPYRDGPLAPGCKLDEHIQKAIITHNSCVEVCIALWQHLHKVLKDDPDFVKLESKYAHVRPRLILFPAQEVPGCEHYYVHNYMIITFSHGISFVFDPSGYQFGFSKILYTLEEYEADIVYGKEMPEEDDIEDAIDTHTRLAQGQPIALAQQTVDGKKQRMPGPMEKRIACQLLDFSFEL